MPTTWMRDPEPDEVDELCERLKEARKHANLKAITGATFRPPDTPRFPNPTGILDVAQGAKDGLLNVAEIGFAAPKKVEYEEKPIRVAVTKNEEKTKVTNQPVSDYVEIPRENYFPVSSSMLRISLEKRTDKSHQDEWNKLCNHLSLIVTAAYKSKVESLRETLSTADADPNFEIDAQTEMDMYSGLSDLALKAGFTPLTQTWFDTASAVDFSFRVPIEVNWEAMGSPVLEQYLRYGIIYKQEECPLFAPHTLIFIRGIDVERKKDLFIPEKIDYILKSPKVNGIGSTLKMVIPRRSKKEVASRTSKGNTVVKRETLKSQFVQRGLVVGAASKVELKEPKFSDLIIIYRLENRLAGLPSAGSRYNFVVQRYHDVPMADIEALFPIRDIKFKTLDYLLMTINFVGLVALLLVSLWSIKGVLSQMEADDGKEKQEGTSASVIMLLVGMIIELVKKLIDISKEWRLMIGTYKNEIANWLDTRRSATGQVVVSALRDQVVEQELKEILLTYWLLWTKGAMKGKKLDEECESLLKDEFGVLADFNYEAGLSKLVTLRLATEIDGVYTVTGTPAQINLRFQNISFLYDVRL